MFDKTSDTSLMMPKNSPSAGCDVELTATEKTSTSASTAQDVVNQHFSTSHLLDSLRERTVSSGLVAIFSQIAQAILNLASVMVLARLLAPEDFGLVAMVMVVINVFIVVGDAGLSAATIQKKEISHAHVSNLFWVNLAVGALLTLVVAAASPLVAQFYNEPRLIGIGLAMSMIFLLRATTVQHTALLARQMQFKKLAWIQIAAMAMGLLVGAGMGLAGFGYWSLVLSTLSIEASRALFTWTISSWRPQVPSRSAGTVQLLTFGASMTAGVWLYSIARSLDNLLIGRRYGSTSVGFYSRAAALFTRPFEQILIPIGSVFMPALSALQNQPARYRHAFLQGYEALTLLGCMTGGMFLAASRPLTLILLGHKWENTAQIFAAFAVAGLYMPSLSAASWLLISQGRSKDYLATNSVVSIVIVLAFLAGLPFGAFGVALSFSLSGLLIRLPILYWIIGRRGPVGVLDLWIRFLRHIPLWLVVFSVTYFSYVSFQDSRPFTQLLICFPIGLVAGLVTIFILPYERGLIMGVIRTMGGLVKRNVFSQPGEHAIPVSLRTAE